MKMQREAKWNKRKHMCKWGLLLLFFCTIMLWNEDCVEAHTITYNVSTQPVQSYQGCNATTCYSGQTTYINFWDENRGNALKSVVLNVYRDGVYDIGDSRSATNYMNWCNFGFTFYTPGNYSYQYVATYTDGATIEGSYDFHIYDQEPIISTHPSAKTVVEGNTATFSVGTSAGTHVKYQWWYNTSNDNSKGYKISGATSSTYSVDTTESMNGRYYFCVVSNDGWQKISNTAKLTVQYAPDITVNNSSVYAYNGSIADFSVDVSGGNPTTYSYQWYYAYSLTGTKYSISGENSSIMGIEASSGNSGRYYFCYVKNGNVGTYSEAMKLNVKYRVKYDGNGGTGIPYSQSKYHDSNLLLSDTEPTRTGYTFLGWSTLNEGIVPVQYEPGDIYSENEDVTLYAVWQTVPVEPTSTPAVSPTPTVIPTAEPTTAPEPTRTPSTGIVPTPMPTITPTVKPTTIPESTSTPIPTSEPVVVPTENPIVTQPTAEPGATTVACYVREQLFGQEENAYSLQGMFVSGSYINISKASRMTLPGGKQYAFNHWVAEGVYLEEPYQSNISFLMPDSEVRLTAVYHEVSQSGSDEPTPLPSSTEVPSATANPTTTAQPTQAPWIMNTAISGEENLETNASIQEGTEIKPGTIITQGSLVYKVLKNSGKDKTVMVVKAKNKKVKTITLPKAIKINSESFKVVEIAKNACKGCKNLKKVTIGTEVKVIGSNAFAKCKKLKTIVIKSKKLKKVGKKAFAGIGKNASIRVPKSKVKVYRNLLK